MTNHMTSTEQDNELREAILLEFKNVYGFAPADYAENCTNFVMHLITIDRERVALEARIDELENNKWLPNEAKWIEQEADRIAGLKAQQEEV